MCHFLSSIWHLLLLFIQYVAPPFCDRFSWCVASFVFMCGASFWSCISHFLYTLQSVFFLYACSFAYPVVCGVFIHVRCCLHFLFRNCSSSIRKFCSLFLCSFVNVIEVKTLVFSSLFPRTLFVFSFLFSWHFKAMLKC